MFAEDLDLFFSLETPGSRAAVFAGNDIVVLFDHAYHDAFGVASRNPVAHARESDVPGIAQGSAISIAGAAYTVAALEPDGEGVLMLQLESA